MDGGYLLRCRPPGHVVSSLVLMEVDPLFRLEHNLHLHHPDLAVLLLPRDAAVLDRLVSVFLRNPTR